MTFKEAINTVWKEKYATMKGRAPRSEYWWSVLFMYIVLIICAIPFIAGMVMLDSNPDSVFAMILAFIGGAAMLIFVLGSIIPMICVVVRRFHDRNLSGWVYLGINVAAIIPIVGIIASIASLVITILKGTEGDNKFGPDPLVVSDVEKVFE